MNILDENPKWLQKSTTSKKPKRKNGKPEAKVVAAIMQYCKLQGWSLKVYESKAKRIMTSSGDVRWKSSGLAFGTPDIMGIDDKGIYIAIEAKAPGKRATVREGQREFCLDIIKHKGFAVIADSVDYVAKVYEKWTKLEEPFKTRYLIDELPTVAQEDCNFD